MNTCWEFWIALGHVDLHARKFPNLKTRFPFHCQDRFFPKSFGLHRHAPNHFFVKKSVPGSRKGPGPILGAILDAFLVTFWEPLGPPWPPLGSLWVPFVSPWGPLAPLGAPEVHLGS